MALSPRDARRARGFTLVELLLATALFSVLGLLMFQIASDAAEVWNDGERNRVLNQRADAAFALLAADLRHVWGGAPGVYEQDARFVSLPRRRVTGEGETARARVSQALGFTRLLHEQRTSAWLRRAGDTAGAERATSLLGNPDPTSLLPTSGLAESLYFTTRLPGADLPSLLRAVRTPIGGPDTLTDPATWDRLDRLLEGALPIADDVLHFGVEFWRPGTDAWTAAEWVEPETPAGGQPPGPPLFATTSWDSTRALASELPGHVGEESLWDGSDDATPLLVRITLVFGADLPTGRLREALSAEGRRLRVADVRFLRDDEERPEFVLVDDEWMRLAGDGTSSTELLVERGARATEASAHDLGATVRVGRTFRRVVRLPAARPGVDR